jgi:hypothetical protein
MRALGAMSNAAGFDDMPKQAQIGDIEPHGLSFVFCEASFHIFTIAQAKSSTILSSVAKPNVTPLEIQARRRVAAAP